MVAVGGAGLVCALGTGSRVIDRLTAGEGGLTPSPLADPRGSARWMVGAAGGARRSTSELAEQVALEAMEGRDGRAVQVVVGSSAGDMWQGEDAWIRWRRGEAFAEEDLVEAQLPRRVADRVGAAIGSRLPPIAVSTACTSGALAIQIAADIVRSGRAPAALAVGADALSASTLYGFGALGLQSDGPARPFDRRRGGLNLGDGAAALLFEARPQRTLGFLIGAGSGSDAWHLSSPHPDNPGGRRAITRATRGRAVGWVHAHGTGTRLNDAAEAALLGECAPGAPVTGTKGALGHTLGAAGAVGAVLALAALERGWIPPALGCEEPEFDLDLVREPRRMGEKSCLSLAFGFGGGAVALLWGAP